MKLKFLKSKQTDGNTKATIHFNGRLGFSAGAVKILGISSTSFIKLAIDEEELEPDTLFLMVTDKADDETYKIYKAGDYYYVNAKLLFDELKFYYRIKKIIFDIREIEHYKTKYFKLSKRELDRKKIKA